MSNQLIKETNTSFVFGGPGIAADPGQPALPAYTSYELGNVCRYTTDASGTDGGVWVQERDYAGNPGPWVFVPGTSGGTRVTYTPIYVCTQQIVPYYHPAQPYIPPSEATPISFDQTIYDFNLGWNAGARSDAFLLGDGYAQWKVPYNSLIGGVLGFNNADDDASYPNMEHSLYFSGKSVRVYESGVQAFFIGSYADADVFKISRTKGVVTYYQNGTLKYTSAVSSYDVAFLDSSLYAGEDYVYDPVIAGYTGTGGDGLVPPPGSDFASSPGSMMPLVGIGMAGLAATFAQGEGSMLPLTGGTTAYDGFVSSAGVFSGSAGSMLALVGLGATESHNITTWPIDEYPITTGDSTVVGTVTGSMVGGVLGGGVFTGTLYAADGTVIGTIQATATGTDTGTGFTGGFIGTIYDPVTGAVIGYVAGELVGTGSGTTSYAASATGTATVVLIPTTGLDAAAPTAVTGTVTGTVGADGTFNGGYTGTLTNPITGVVTGIVTGTVTGTVDADGTLHAVYTATVTDPTAGAVIGVIVGAVNGVGTLTPLPDGSSTFVETGVSTSGSFIPVGSGGGTGPTTTTVTTYGDSQGSLQPLTGSAGFLPTPPLYALGAGALNILIGGGISLTGEIGGGATTMTELQGFSVGGFGGSYNFAMSTASMLPLAGYGHAYEGNDNASIGNFAVLGDAWIATPILAVVMTSSGSVVSVIALNIAIDATLHSDAGVATSLAFTSLLNALMQTTVSVGAVVPPYEADHVVYVVNTDTSATSTYESYPFNSYALFDGAYFGMKSDGLFKLEGDNDNGTAISASVSFGKQNFGSAFKKRMTAAYIGLSSTGKMYLKITDGAGVENIYAARRSDDYLRQQRVDVGRGIEASYLTFELFNKAGADFELATVEFQATQLTRRI